MEDENRTLMAFVIPKPVLALEDRLDKKGDLLANPRESRQDYKNRQQELFNRSAKPVIDYLVKKRIMQDYFATEGFIITYPKPQEYEELSNQPFIKSIIVGDTEIDLVA